MPSGASHSAGPMPERCSTCIDPIEPAHRMTSPLARASTDLTALHEAHADRASVLDDQPIDQHVFFEPQIGSLQGRLQKPSRRRPAAAALLVDVEIADAFIVAGVEVRNSPDSHFLSGIADRVQNCPGQPRRFDPPAAAAAMMLALAEEMILKTPEGGLHVIPAPAGEAELTPMIVVGRLSAHRDHGVDRGRAADHLAAGIRQRAAVQAGFRLGPEHPVRARISDRKQIAHRNVKPDPVVIAAGLQHQHAVLRIGGEPVGHDAAGGARADDDIVEITFEPSAFLNFRQSVASCPPRSASAPVSGSDRSDEVAAVACH